MKKTSKITITQVQKDFNRAIVRRDNMCLVRDYRTNCSGVLNCSHYFPVGGNGALRFYPYKAFAQCAGHHFTHHNRDPQFYTLFMLENYRHELEWMNSVRGKTIRYTQPMLKEISKLCKEGKLKELAKMIREVLA